MALATAQALGLNVIGGIMSLTKEHLVMDIDDAALPRSGRTAFSDAEPIGERNGFAMWIHRSR